MQLSQQISYPNQKWHVTKRILSQISFLYSEMIVSQMNLRILEINKFGGVGRVSEPGR